MATVTLTFTDREDGTGFDLRGEFDPPLDTHAEPTDAQQAVLDIANDLAQDAVGDITAEDSDGNLHVL